MKKGYVNLKKYGFILDKTNVATGKKARLVWLRGGAAEALVKARNLLGEGYNFKIGEGKRSLEEQRAIIKICEKDFKKNDPINWKEMLIRYTGGYSVLKQEKFEPNTHLGGGAVDLKVIRDGKELDLGKVKLNESSNLNYYENKNKLTNKQKIIRDNRRLLKKVMKRVGFKPYLPEWWHWGYSK